MKENKYNYVFCNINEDYLMPIFDELSNLPFAKVFKHAFTGNKLEQKLFFLHWSAKLNRKIRLPFKFIWYKKMCQHKFPENKPTCFVFLGGKYICQDKGLLKYIRKLNPENKCVVLYLDLIAKRKIDIEKVKKIVDVVVSYDKEEAEMFEIAYQDMDYYTPLIPVTTPDTFENDVYFSGFAKDRLNDIHKVYNHLSNEGLKCKFIVCGTKEEDRISGEGLIYSSPVSYLENLENVNRSRCVLELIQGDSVAPTLRLREAKTYKRKLITNNTNPQYKQALTEENLLVFEGVEKITKEFVSSPIDYSLFDENYSSPVKLIDYLEEIL